ncbi:DNA-directed RNA polymerase III subunit RPC4 [Clarias magur]|uniref:DNA-directed RNA polymerase III subunit RPC4 n=1 Tax=Clarias magur TaxID=1594786 RepID=A0A8J4TTA1_CLAMG|nr:DNA-directed RNA polymerase III subunit RPC4 [Clarias magur]
MATPGSGDSSSNPRPAAGGRGSMLNLRTPGRLPAMRSRDMTLGGVKKKTFTPNIISRKSKEELKANEGPRRERKDADRGRQRDGRGRGRGRPEVIQSHSIFEQGPAEMMAKRRGVYEDTRETPNSAPCPIINIKKETRETEEETKEILRKLERDNFMDDPQLRNEARCCPVQLPLAVSGWVFKEEPEEDAEDQEVKVEKCAEDSVTVKQEPPDVPVVKKAEPTFKPPPLPEPDLLPDLLQVWSRCKEEELLFMQLPDSLPGQPPTSDARPAKTTVQSEDGQNLLQKTEGQQLNISDLTQACLRGLAEGNVVRIVDDEICGKTPFEGEKKKKWWKEGGK